MRAFLVLWEAEIASKLADLRVIAILLDVVGASVRVSTPSGQELLDLLGAACWCCHSVNGGMYVIVVLDRPPVMTTG